MIREALAIRQRLLHPRNVTVLRTLSAVLNVALVRQDWAVARQVCEQIVDCYRHVYFGQHPRLGLQLYTLGDLRVREGAEGAAAAAAANYEEARRILTLTHGERGAMVQGLNALLSQPH